MTAVTSLDAAPPDQPPAAPGNSVSFKGDEDAFWRDDDDEGEVADELVDPDDFDGAAEAGDVERPRNEDEPRASE